MMTKHIDANHQTTDSSNPTTNFSGKSTWTSSSIRSHLVVGSLRQTQFSSSQFCHGLRLSDGSHVSVDTLHPSLLRSSSLSSPGWCHLQGLSTYVVLVSPLYVAKPPVSRFPAPLCDTLYLQSLFDVFVSHSMDDACELWPNHDISVYVVWHASSTDVHVCLL